MGCAGLIATQQAARAEGNVEAAEKTKVGQMFSSGSPLAPFVEPLTMYYQVSQLSTSCWTSETPQACCVSAFNAVVARSGVDVSDAD